MSEPNSLYINVKIKKEELQQFFAAKPTVISVVDYWQQWWETREMYSKSELTYVPFYPEGNNREIIDSLLKSKYLGAVEQYDEATQCWIFTSLYFSENYFEILPMLSFIKHLATYSESGAAIIYDYMWGDDSVMAFFDISEGKALLQTFTKSSQVAYSFLEVANKGLQAAAEELSKKYGD